MCQQCTQTEFSTTADLDQEDYYNQGLIPMWRDHKMYATGNQLVKDVAAKRDERTKVYETFLEGHTGDAFLVKAGQTIRLELTHPTVQVCDWIFITPDLKDFQCYGNSAAFQGFYLHEGYQILGKTGRMKPLATLVRDEAPADYMPEGWGHHFWHWHCSPEWTEILYAENIPAGINTCHMNFSQALNRIPAIHAIEDDAERREMVNNLANNHNFQTFQVMKHQDTKDNNCVMLLGGSPDLPVGTGVEFYCHEDMYVCISSCPGVNITEPAWDGEAMKEPTPHPVKIIVSESGVTPPVRPEWKDWDSVFYGQIENGEKDISPRVDQSCYEKKD
ncbi:hypothetical protein JCM19240_2416 [Vibrio maritimus]|uniref:DUF1989 domain-containing protein n=1 Tax=Vibrio maritimus TaxID=990268 RepID=A0A090T129_9VIBR|nr:hypothetical protein JCM19240_2416 [Vibrio maritimus]